MRSKPRRLSEEDLRGWAADFSFELLTPYLRWLKRNSPGLLSKEINDPLWGTIRLHPFEVAVLDSPLLQRLRFIRQLGVAHWVYPGAVHTRFEHSLGTLYQIQQLITALNASAEPERPWISPEHTTTLRLAAMLHDVGHSIFSHVSEHALEQFANLRECLTEFGSLHGLERLQLTEVMSYFIIKSDPFVKMLNLINTKIALPFRAPTAPSMGQHLSAKLADAIIGKPIDDEIPLLHELITGPFDADKLDYFARDARSVGIPNVLDISRLTQKLIMQPISKKDLPPKAAEKVGGEFAQYKVFGIKWSGSAVLDELHLARILLFAKVYRHPKVLAIEAMVEALFLATSRLIPLIDLIKLAYLYCDDELIQSTPEDTLIRIPRLPRKSVAVKFANEILRRLRARELFVKAFTVQLPYPEDPWSDSSEQKRGLSRFVEELSNTRTAPSLRRQLAHEVRAITKLVPSVFGKDFPRSWIEFSIMPSTKPKISGGTQIDRALVFQGLRPIAYSKLTVQRAGWADAYNFSAAAAHLFCPREIAVATYIAAEKILRQKYAVILPSAAPELSKQNERQLADLKTALETNGYYKGIPYDIRPPPTRLLKADVEHRVETIAAKLMTVQAPVVIEDSSAKDRFPIDPRPRVESWLKQFRTDQYIDSALSILEHLKILSRTDTYEALTGFLLRHPEFRGACVCVLGGNKDSSAVQNYFALDQAQLGESQSIAQVTRANSGKPIIFLDDFIGSGGQVQDLLGHWFERQPLKKHLGEKREALAASEQRYLRKVKLAFVFVAGWNAGITALNRACRDLDLKHEIYVHIRESDIPFAFENCLNVDQPSVQQFKRKCKEIGTALLTSTGTDPKSVPKRALGYGNRAMLLLSPINVPTQTLTCLWHPGVFDLVSWMPLVSRRKKT